MSEIRNLKLVIFCLLLAISYTLSASSVYSATFSKPPSNLGLIGYWSFDEGTSTIAHDFSGFGQNGTLTNMESHTDWINGKRGKALDFDGVNEYVTIPDTQGRLNVSTTVTISMWVKDSTWDDGDLLSKAADSYAFWSHVGTGMRFGRQGGSENQWAIGPFPQAGRWVHIVGVSNGSNALLYYDGVLVATSGASMGTLNNGGAIAIGAGVGTGDDGYVSAQIDDVRIYNRALSQDEIKALATVGQTTRTGVSERGLVGQWSFDEGTSTIAHDFSGNGNDGILESMESNDWVNGKRGKALSFDNAGNERVSIGNSPSVQLTVGTMSAWIKTSNAGSSYRGIIAKQMAYGMFLNNNSFSIYDWGGSAERASGRILNDDKWHHVACSFQSGVGSGTFCYVDGLLVLTTSMTVSNQSVPVYIAEANATQFFNGSIDDVRIYNRVLSFAEVKSLYQQNKTLINAPQKDQLTNGLVGYWSLNAPDIHWPTNVAYDRSGRGNNGSISSMSSVRSPISGVSGQALNFDGVDDTVSVDGLISDVSDSTFSYSVWVKPNAAITGGGFSEATSGTLGCNATNGVIKGYKDSPNVGVELAVGTNGVSVSEHSAGHAPTVASYSATLSGWVHIALVSTSTSSMGLYVNGVQRDTALNSSLSRVLDVDSIGSKGSCSNKYFNGRIDEVRLYNRGLSDLEVKQLYGMGRK